MRNRVVLAVGLLMCLFAVPALILAAQNVPSRMNYQAVLTSSGVPVTTTVNVTFRIYDVASGGTALWSETRSVTPDAAGRVSAQLGQNNPLDATTFNGADRWLAVEVESDGELSPRTALASSGYSFKVSTIDGAEGGELTGDVVIKGTSSAMKDFMMADATLTLESLTGQKVVIGPAGQVILRASDEFDNEQMAATIDPVRGPMLGIRDNGGNYSEHLGMSSIYYGDDAAKGSMVVTKRMEVGKEGLTTYDLAGDPSMSLSAGTGRISGAGAAFGSNNALGMMVKDANGTLLTPDPGFVYGDNNTITGENASVIGNWNTLGGDNAVAIGDSNSLPGMNAIAFGNGNTLSGSHSMALGSYNEIDVEANGAFVIGVENVVTTLSDRCFVIGAENYADGFDNICFGSLDSIKESSLSSILGGTRNRIIEGSDNCVIFSGDTNRIAGSIFSVIGGGEQNRIDKADNGGVTIVGACIGGGSQNIASRDGAAVSAGRLNVASGDQSFVGGGYGNMATNRQTTVAGGSSNEASGEAATVAGGQECVASGLTSFVGGGYLNEASNQNSVVTGGEANTATGNYATVSGGRLNSAAGDFATVGGGGGTGIEGNHAGGVSSTVSGGRLNSATGLSSTVSGGWNCDATADYATVGGGFSSQASATYATVAGGREHVADGSHATISGGRNNEAHFDGATVGGGINNNASNSYGTVAGGNGNTAGYSATVPGGASNTASGQYAFAAGRRARATYNGAFVWADQSNFDFPTANDNGGSNPLWLTAPGQNMFMARTTGGVTFVSGVDGSGNATNGVQLAPGSGAWSPMCAREAKENFAPIDGDEVLQRIAALDIGTWNYRAQDDAIRHIGPVAQDFYAQFGVGESERHISTIDADGVALAAIKALYEKTQRIDDLEAEVAQLKALIAQLIAERQ